MTQSRIRRVLLRPLSCCLLIFALLILPLDAQSIWWDEGISLHLAGLPWGDILRDRAANIHPPLYFLILMAWTELVGRTPFAGRAAALMAALAPLFIIYGQETRAYALLPVGVIALWSLVWPPRAGGPEVDTDPLRPGALQPRLRGIPEPVFASSTPQRGSVGHWPQRMVDYFRRRCHVRQHTTQDENAASMGRQMAGHDSLSSKGSPTYTQIM